MSAPPRRPNEVQVTSESSYAQRIVAGDHTLAADEPAGRGGSDTGPTPSDLVLGGLGACTAITLRMYADRKSWQLGTIDVRLGLRRAHDTDRIVRRVSFSAAISDEQRARLADICERTPVTLLLKSGIAIETQVGVGHVRGDRACRSGRRRVEPPLRGHGPMPDACRIQVDVV